MEMRQRMDYQSMYNTTDLLLKIIKEDLADKTEMSKDALIDYLQVAFALDYQGKSADVFRKCARNAVNAALNNKSKDQIEINKLYFELVRVALIPRNDAEHYKILDLLEKNYINKTFKSIQEKKI